MDSVAGRRRYESPLRQEQQLATRERILAALANVMAKDGTATVPAVAERAGVSERTVYRHFPTREDLYRALFTWVTDLAPETRAEPTSVDELVAQAHEIFPRYELRPEVVRALNAHELGQNLRRSRAGYRRATVQGALASSLEGMPDDQRQRVEAAVHVLASSSAYLHLHDFWDMSAEEAAEAVEWAVRALVRAATEKGEHDGDAAVGRARNRKLGR